MIENRAIEKEMRYSYLDYAMSVILSRAIPDVRDGLKPVQRRILYSMYEMGITFDKPYRKSARIVGEVMGKYHPHGDAAIYSALVRMAQDFSLRYPLIQGQGNFGCFTGDTKIRLSDGRDISFRDLVEEHKKGIRHYTYAYDTSTGSIVEVEVKNPRVTKRNAQVVSVKIDNGEIVRCTPDHRFMMRDGSFKEASNLRTGDSLMPLPEISATAVVNTAYNHKVVSVEPCDDRTDVYDITIEGYHNFPLSAGVFVHNSVDDDPPAAMRYTEAKLSKISNEMLLDIEYETVDYTPTFDGTLKEPLFLPSKLPNILLNGSSGIAVGMTTNMPPHNLSEVVDGLIYLIRNRDATVEELMQFIKGPDFPTGGLILGRKGILDAYRTGRGKIDLRARAEIKKNEIIFTEIPYEVNKAEMLSKMAELSREGIIEGISSIKDESNKEGIRIVIKVKGDFNPEVTLNQIYEHTQAQISYGIINLVVVDNVPKTMGLKEIMEEYLKHRELVVRRRTEFFLKKANERAHIIEALIKAVDELDLTLSIIRKSRDAREAKESLKSRFNIDDQQADAILDMKLQKLTGTEISDLKREMDDLTKSIERYKDLLRDEGKRWDLIVEELEEMKEKYGDSRRTEITDSFKETTEEELIPHELDTILLTEDNRIIRLETDAFSSQKRGGKGVFVGSSESSIRQIITCDSHDRVFMFSDDGKVYQMKAFDIPKGERRSRAKLISAVFENIKGKIVFLMSEHGTGEKKYLLFVTKEGRVKKTDISEFTNIRSNGIIALKLKENDVLKDVFMTSGNERIALLSTDGRLVIVDEKEFRPMGRAASGVTGIRFREGQEVASDTTVSADDLIIITEKGLGKRVKVEEFSQRHRGAKGMKALKVTERTGKPIFISSISKEGEFLLVTRNGKSIRTDISQIPQKGRYAQGVKLIGLDEGDAVVSVTLIS
ncbi:MAG: DNA gyrase subunit A [Thermoplasmatales archaeon]